MKKAVVIFVLLVMLTLAFTSVAYAQKPFAHADTGREFGCAVSTVAKEDPAILVEHILAVVGP